MEAKKYSLKTHEGRGKKVCLLNRDMLKLARELRYNVPKLAVLLHNFGVGEQGLAIGGSPQSHSQEAIFGHSDARATVDTSDCQLLLGKVTFGFDTTTGERVDPWSIDLATAAAIKLPKHRQLIIDQTMQSDYHSHVDRAAMRRKIRLLLTAASNYDIFITGAWGMGPFGNPKYGLIQLWNDCLEEFNIKTHILFCVTPGDWLLFKKYMVYDHVVEV
jgi:hypothetical protein